MVRKEVVYLRDKNIKDGGPVYMNRPVLQSRCIQTT